MRARHHLNCDPSATVYGSPSSVQFPAGAVKYPNPQGDLPKYVSACGPAPRWSTWYGHTCSLKSFIGFSIGPASSSVTLTPRSVSTLVTVPPPAPDPITTTSCTSGLP